jgi:hypothetical protein
MAYPTGPPTGKIPQPDLAGADLTAFKGVTTMSRRRAITTVLGAGAAAIVIAGSTATAASATRGQIALTSQISSAATTPSADPGCSQVGKVTFDKTKFVLHAGLAFGAFHHFIYGPFKAGGLHGVAPLAKAGTAGLFTVHELKLAKADAESSPTLCHLAAPFDNAGAALSSSIGNIKSGKASSADMEALNSKVNAVQSGAQADGVPAPDQIPNAAQLASGGN